MKTCAAGQGRRALTLIELLVIIVIIAILVGMLLPYSGPRHQRNALQTHCVNSLREIGTAFGLWADDNNGYYPMHFVGNPNYPQLIPSNWTTGYPTNYLDAYMYFQALSNELSTPRLVTCPVDSRDVATNFATLQNANVSYFVGLDATPSNSAAFLAGDRNLMTNGIPITSGFASIATSNIVSWSETIHHSSGNAAFADGSTQKFSSGQLQKAIANAGTNINRLMFP